MSDQIGKQMGMFYDDELKENLETVVMTWKWILAISAKLLTTTKIMRKKRLVDSDEKN